MTNVNCARRVAKKSLRVATEYAIKTWAHNLKEIIVTNLKIMNEYNQEYFIGVQNVTTINPQQS